MSYTDNPRYLELADQIENHSRAIGYAMEELNKLFPPKYIPNSTVEAWVVIQHRPTLTNLLNSGDR